jgi:endoglucanase
MRTWAAIGTAVLVAGLVSIAPAAATAAPAAAAAAPVAAMAAPLSATAAPLSAAPATTAPTAAAAAAAALATLTPTAPTPVVSGNRILDSRTGAVFVPHGANWPSFEYACTATSGAGWGYNDGGATKAAADAMVSWHINTVRIPLNQDCWLGANPSHDYGTAAGYRAALKSWVDILNADGIVAILDLHWNAPAGKIASDQYPMADAQSVTFWSQVAAAYRDDPSVIFDAFNEPYSRWNPSTNSWAFQLSWDCWENGGCLAPDVDQNSPLDGGTYPVVGMSALVAAIRNAGAQQPVMLGGIDYANDLTGWLAHRPNDSQLIASWHNYPGQACDTTACWNSEIAPVAAQVPVITGETGETDGGSSFLTTFMTWADSHGIGYLPWAWWDVSASESLDNSRYALYSGSSFTPKAPAGTAYHAHLAALATPAPTATPLPLVNGSFENGTKGWRPHSNHFTLASGSKTTIVHDGKKYLSATARRKGRGFQQVVKFAVRPGDRYTATVWLRTQTASSERVKLSLAADGGHMEYTSTTVTVTKSWKRYAIAVAVKKTGHKDVRLAVYLGTANRGVFADGATLSVTR